MASDFPYMATTKNLADILSKIQKAGTPPKFTVEFLQKTLGFKSSNDRAVLGVLKGLAMVSADGTPTPRYNEYKDPSRGPKVLAAGLREGWAGIFLADEEAYSRTATELKGIFQSVTGKGESVADQMARTFKIIADQADWSGEESPGVSETDSLQPEDTLKGESSSAFAGAGVALHNDIHIHLPTSTEVAVYTAVFRALREELLDG